MTTGEPMTEMSTQIDAYVTEFVHGEAGIKTLGQHIAQRLAEANQIIVELPAPDDPAITPNVAWWETPNLRASSRVPTPGIETSLDFPIAHEVEGVDHHYRLEEAERIGLAWLAAVNHVRVARSKSTPTKES